MSYAFIEMRLSEVQSRPPEIGALQMELKKNGAVHRVKHNRIDLSIEQNGAEMPTAKDLILNEQLSPKNKNDEKPAKRDSVCSPGTVAYYYIPGLIGLLVNSHTGIQQGG